MIGPEEVVRQEFLRILMDDYGYLEAEIEIEFPIPRGSSSKDRADIAVFRGAGRDPAADVIGLVETKKPGDKSGKRQLKSYMTATSAIWGVWTNGSDIEHLCKPQGQSSIYGDRLNNIPVRGQRLEDVGKLTRSDLVPYSGAMLKASFRRILNTLYANTTISRREKLGNEMIKLIFAKIRDETTYVDSPPSFYAGYDENPASVKERIDRLFADVVAEYQEDGLFDEHDKITLDARGIAWAVGQLERGSLVETPTDVVGDAFEVFAESKFVGEKGEFFTPRGVIDVAVKIVDPKPNETICDPACGSGGFLIATMRSMWEKMSKDRRWRGLSVSRMQTAQEKMARKCFFGIDKEIDLVRIAKAYMAIVLPETPFHAPSRAHLREYVSARGRILAVIDLPHNTFRPHCNAKTCLLILQKGAPARPSDKVVMAEAVEMGHDHNGKEMYRPGTNEVWDDLRHILNELNDPDDPKNEFVFTVPWATVEATGHLIPRYYAVHRRVPPPPPEGREWITLKQLVDENVVDTWDGHGSPSSKQKGEGDIPYIRVADIVNWELYRNPTSGVTAETWRAFTNKKRTVDTGDVIFVRRGSYRVGTVAMASHRDSKIVMTRELLTLRVAKDNAMGMTPYYLLALLSSREAQDQMRPLTFYDTTLPNMGARWREIRLPVHRDHDEREEMSKNVEKAIRAKWKAQDDIDELRRTVGDLVT